MTTFSASVKWGRGRAKVEQRDVDGTLIRLAHSKNLIPYAARDYFHAQMYGLSQASGGFNWFALSNDPLTETVLSVALSNEIVSNGLQRTQGVVSHTAGTDLTTINQVLTATATVSAQKFALFTQAYPGGIMCHVFAFTQFTLTAGQTLGLTVQITVD